MIIYPPLIADTIPAFTQDKIIIPFIQNPAVSPDEVIGFRLIIKDYQNSKTIAILSAAADNISTGKVVFSKNENNFEIIEGEWNPISSQYYKFQLAYDDGSNYFAYSAVSIGRCLSEAVQFEILGLSEEMTNDSKKEYLGKYIRPISSEPLYSYCFTIKDQLGNTLETTETTIWNVDNDEKKDEKNFVSNIKFKPSIELSYGIVYTITFTITTINNYSETKKYKIIKSGGYDPYFTGRLKINSDYNNGCAIITFSEDASPIDAKFILERTKDKKHWDEIFRFEMSKDSPLENFKYIDFSIEHGVEYIYSLSQYVEKEEETIYSNRILSPSVKMEFEDIFLSDKYKQLKIRFNPKISGLKNTILEQKTDTIGSQYPFFFRNGNVKYKEFPISGLISYLMDDNKTFMTNKELNLTENDYTTSLTNQNIFAERIFKINVMEWLSNGEPKLYRSPTEGNYVIRLMNVNLNPNDTLGRMLHTFSATAYEIADNNIETLKKLHLINEIEPSDYMETIKTVDIPEGPVTSTYTNVKNIVWNTNIPSIEESITLDNQIFHNFAGNFSTPLDFVYEEMQINLKENNGSSLIFDQIIKYEYNPENDNFHQLIFNNNLEQVWITVNSDFSDLNNEIKYIHYLTASTTKNDSYLIITYPNGETENIELVEGQIPIIIENLGQVSIKLTGGATATLLVSKGVPKI